jgi:hypothetical protein
MRTVFLSNESTVVRLKVSNGVPFLPCRSAPAFR